MAASGLHWPLKKQGAASMNLSPQSRACDEMDRCYRDLQATRRTDPRRREKRDTYERALREFLRTVPPPARVR